MFKTIGFKIIDIYRGTRILKTYKNLKKIQYLSSKELELLSEKYFNVLWQKAKDDVPYYHRFESYNDLPILNKQLIKNDYNLFFSTNRKKKIRKKTGGSTGEPFVYYTSKKSQSYLWAGILLSWDAAGWTFKDKIAFLAGSSILGSGWKQKVYYWLMNVVPLDSFDLTEKKMDQYINNLSIKNVKFLYGYANSIYYLAKFNKYKKNKLLLKSVITTAENLTEEMRQEIANSFECEVFNQYGCNDAGLSAFECVEHNGFHIINTRAFFEVLDDGRLISTDTMNDVMPMIKYDSGDVVELSQEKCQCGRGFPLIKRIKGRSNDVIVNPKTGAVVHSEFFNHLFREDERILLFQIIIEYNKLVLKIESRRKFDCEKYKTIIKDKIGYDNIDVKFNEKFELLPNGKMKTVINNKLNVI